MSSSSSSYQQIQSDDPLVRDNIEEEEISSTSETSDPNAALNGLLARAQRQEQELSVRFPPRPQQKKNLPMMPTTPQIGTPDEIVRSQEALQRKKFAIAASQYQTQVNTLIPQQKAMNKELSMMDNIDFPTVAGIFLAGFFISYGAYKCSIDVYGFFANLFSKPLPPVPQ